MKYYILYVFEDTTSYPKRELHTYYKKNIVEFLNREVD